MRRTRQSACAVITQPLMPGSLGCAGAHECVLPSSVGAQTRSSFQGGRLTGLPVDVVVLVYGVGQLRPRVEPADLGDAARALRGDLAGICLSMAVEHCRHESLRCGSIRHPALLAFGHNPGGKQ